MAVLAGAAAGRGYADAADAESQELAQTLGGASIAYCGWFFPDLLKGLGNSSQVERSGTQWNTKKYSETILNGVHTKMPKLIEPLANWRISILSSSIRCTCGFSMVKEMRSAEGLLV